MLRVAEHFSATDTGRMRQGNEDNFFVRSPLFAVCDGMGGAQAGEVASEIAARAFAAGIPEGEAPEQGLAHIIEDANSQIYQTARQDEGRHGMGCTCTAFYVDNDELAVGHVGDSRGYRLRDGKLDRITKDHSLMQELIDTGKMTEEEAERHPQRSVITRALGPEPEVDVSTATHGIRAGDVYLLCSDGLTGMVPEPRIESTLAAEGALEGKGRELIAAANAAGGRDNITVILFRIEEVLAPTSNGDDRTDVTTELDATSADEYEEYDEAELAEPGPRQGITKAESTTSMPTTEVDERAAEWEQQRPATVALAAVRPGMSAAEAAAELEQAKPPDKGARPPVKRTVPLPDDKPKRSRRSLFIIAILVIIVVLLTGGWIATRAVYFIGADTKNANAVAIYRGVPYELPGGLKLYQRYAVSGVTLEQIPNRRRPTFTDHKLRSLDDAEDLVNQLETGKLE